MTEAQAQVQPEHGSAADLDTLNVGDVVAERELTFTRDRLVRYAGASLDFNPIHYRDDVAASVGLPGVLAHGMLTMGAAAAPVADWLGGAGFVRDLQVRFTRPIVVDADLGAQVKVVATVSSVDREARTAAIDLKVTSNDQTVLGKSKLVVAFS